MKKETFQSEKFVRIMYWHVQDADRQGHSFAKNKKRARRVGMSFCNLMFLCAVMTTWIECGTACKIKHTTTAQVWQCYDVV